MESIRCTRYMYAVTAAGFTVPNTKAYDRAAFPFVCDDTWGWQTVPWVQLNFLRRSAEWGYLQCNAHITGKPYWRLSVMYDHNTRQVFQWNTSDTRHYWCFAFFFHLPFSLCSWPNYLMANHRPICNALKIVLCVVPCHVTSNWQRIRQHRHWATTKSTKTHCMWRRVFR